MPTHRTCKGCGIDQPIESFPHSASSLWRRHLCRPCYNARALEKMNRHYAENREAIKAKRKEQRAKRRALGIKEQRRQRPEEYRAKKSAADKRERAVLRVEVFSAYGGVRCACCGEPDIRFLTIDHINDNGADERRETGLNGGHRFYRWLKKQGFPPGYQVLCFNCNCGRHHNGGVCPHKAAEAV